MADIATNQQNIDAVLADFKANSMASKNTDWATKFASGIFGAELGKIAGFVPGLIGKGLDAVFGKKQPWSGLDGDNKGNLIDGLALEAIYVKRLVTVELVKSYIYTRLKAEKIITTTGETDFWTKNDWAKNHVVSYIQKYNETLSMVNRISDSMKSGVDEYETSKMQRTALTAIYNLKKGQQPTVDEKQAIVAYANMMKAVELSKSLRNN